MRDRSCAGFALLPVVLMVALLAAIAFLITHEGAIGTRLARSAEEAAEADYVAEAGLRHALWHTRNDACGGDRTVPATTLGQHSYTATVNAGGTTTAHSLAVDQDAWIRNDQPDVNKGSEIDQHVRYQAGNVEHALYRFDLSSLPPGARIQSASAAFFIEATREHPEGPLTLHPITAAWTEGSVTWNSFDAAYDPVAVATIPPQSRSGDWVRVNLTGQVQAWMNGQPNHGILLASESEGVHAEYVSGDGAEPPRLDVVVGATPVSPASVSATGTLASGVVRTRSRTGTPAYQSSSSAALQPDAAGGMDAYVNEWSKNANYGDADATQVATTPPSFNTKHALLAFDLAAIPLGSKILSATLSLHHRDGNDSDVPVTAHRITQAWSESEVTWNERQSGTGWDDPGGDFDRTALATREVGPGSLTWYEWDLTSLAQDWSDGTHPNHGVLLRTVAPSIYGERFDTSDHADPARRPRFDVSWACECGRSCVAPLGSGTLLMVVGNPSNLEPGDVAARDHFERWGYTTSLIQDDDSQGNFNAAITASDVVYVSESVTAANVGTKLTGAAIGVVNTEGDLNDELGISSGRAQPVGSTVDVVDTDHFITRIFPAAPLEFALAGVALNTVSGNVAPDAQVLARLGGAGTLVSLDSGAALDGGGSAAGRRVLLPHSEASADWHLTNAGQLVVQRALAWGMGSDPTVPGLPVLLVVGNAASLSSKDAGRKALMESWDFDVVVIDDSETEKALEDASAAADVVFVSGSIGGGTLADKLTGTPTGIVNEFPGKIDNFGFSSSTGGTIDADTFSDSDALHYVTSPFGGAAIGAFGLTLSMPVPSGTLAPDLQNLAEVDDGGSGVPALVALNSGARRWDGGFAPARRVHLPFRSAETTDLSAEGETLMRRALEWAAGLDGGGGPSVEICEGTFRDEFNAVSYAGNDGTLSWTGDWEEINESDGPNGGDERVMNDVSNFQLRVTDNDGDGEGVQREVDLHRFTKVALSFRYRRASLDDEDDYVSVEVSSNGGTSWTRLQTLQGPGNDTGYLSAGFDLSGHATANTRIRFLSSPDLGKNDGVWFDDVTIEAKGCASGPKL